MNHFFLRFLFPLPARRSRGATGRAPLRVEELEPRSLLAADTPAASVVQLSAPDVIRVLSGGPALPGLAAALPPSASSSVPGFPLPVAATLTTNVAPAAPPANRLDGGGGGEIAGGPAGGQDLAPSAAPFFDWSPDAAGETALVGGPDTAQPSSTRASDIIFSQPLVLTPAAGPANADGLAASAAAPG
jgi:hypothetical protein